jgi:hypothetical protein
MEPILFGGRPDNEVGPATRAARNEVKRRVTAGALPVALRYADAQVAAERERIAAAIEAENCYGDPVCEAAYFHAARIARAGGQP